GSAKPMKSSYKDGTAAAEACALMILNLLEVKNRHFTYERRRELKSPVLPQDWKEIVASLISMEAESERCARLVASFLQLSRRPRPGAEGDRTSINQLLADLLRVYEQQYATTSIRIVKTFDSRAPQVAGDPDQMQEVFLNLISNAWQAMPKGGTIEIITEQKDEWVAVTVRDSGIGIKKDDLKKIFDPFFTTKPLGKGTGLGLPIASSIVTRCGGTIKVESEEGQGATFVVRLPLAGVETDELPLFAKGNLP
ncbi:MAG: HAMP domain-containing sensor histidine kinase, partial [Planctomycetota bacterium]|nr:HAMP domain-containing sensor histidine kinase [Planctomycetota bacterium]